MLFFWRSILVLISAAILFASFVLAQEKRAADLLLIRVDEKAGFIDRTGKIVIEPQFEEAEEFAEGIAPVKTNGKWGFIDESGKFVVEPKFSCVFWYFLSEGITPVCFEGKMGAIDTTGKFVVEPKYEMIYKFSEGVVPVQKEKSEYFEKWIYVDKQGKQIIDKEFYGASVFSAGRAFVEVGFDEWALIDKSGNEVTKKHFNSFDHFNVFSEGLAAVKVKDKYGYIDRNGKFVIKPRFAGARNFSEGLAAVDFGCSYGYINPKGEIIIKPQYSFAGDFSEGLAAASPERKNRLILKSGGKIYCPLNAPGLIGYIDKTGEMIVEPQFAYGFNFSNGIAQISSDMSWDNLGYIDRRGYIDKTGKYIWKPTK